MTIAEVSRQYDISADTLRYYERIGLIPAVGRSKSGIRDYSENDCGWVEFIKCMRGAGLSIESLVEYVALFQQGDRTAQARKQLLVEQREQLLARMEEMRRTLERLDYKIERYENIISQAEQSLRRTAQEAPGPFRCSEYTREK